MAVPIMQKEDGVFPEGPYEAWATPDGMRAGVFKNDKNGKPRRVKLFKGESAHADAVREAGDLNASSR